VCARWRRKGENGSRKKKSGRMK
jgi:hypothetical protein